jgi:hypothetical protein
LPEHLTYPVAQRAGQSLKQEKDKTMAFDDEFLKGILSDAEKSEADKISLIMGEHKAFNAALLRKRDELLEKEIKLKDELRTAKEQAEEAGARIAEMAEQVKKNVPEEKLKILEAEKNRAIQELQTAKESLEARNKDLETSHRKRIFNDAYEDAIKGHDFKDEKSRKNFRREIEELYQFEYTEIDGEPRFFTKDSKDIATIVNEYAVSKDGQYYLKNAATGGGASGAGAPPASAMNVNPWAKDTLNLTQQGQILKENPDRAALLKAQAGAA